MATEWPTVVVVVLVAVTAGCSGPLMEFSASPATIPESALASTEYHHQNTTEVPLSYPVGMGGLAQPVTVQTWLSAYSPVENDRASAVLVVVSSPDVVLAGQSLNPLTELSNRELTRFVLEQMSDAQRLGGISGPTGLREVGTRTVTVLGSETSLVSYVGDAPVDGQNVSVTINVLSVTHGSDVIVVLGLHPTSTPHRSIHAELAQAIEHESP